MSLGDFYFRIVRFGEIGRNGVAVACLVMEVCGEERDDVKTDILDRMDAWEAREKRRPVMKRFDIFCSAN